MLRSEAEPSAVPTACGARMSSVMPAQRAMATGLDRMSGGRFALGVPLVGVADKEALPYSPRARACMAEMIAVLRDIKDYAA